MAVSITSDCLFTAIRIFRPAAKAIPVIGNLIEGVLESVYELRKQLEYVKSNRKKAKELVDREALLSYTVARNLQTCKRTELTKMEPLVQELQSILKTITECLARQRPVKGSNSLIGRAGNFAKRVVHADADADELQSLNRRLNEAIERCNLDMAMHAAIANLRKEDSDDIRRLQDTLEPVFEALHDSHVAPPRCLNGTRVALLDELFQWALSKDRERVFWLSGMAGTGKSAVARSISHRIAQHITSREDEDANVQLISFFLTRDVVHRRSPLRLLHTLAYFLARALPDFRVELLAALSQRPELVTQSLKVQVEELVAAPLAKCTIACRLVIVIDAFDECDRIGGVEGGDLLPALLSLIRQSTTEVRLLFTSRNEHTIDSMFAQCREERTLRLHDIERATVEKDIRAYFQHELPDLLPQQLSSLITKANGLFIYAATVVRFVTLNEYFDKHELLAGILASYSPGTGIVPDYAQLDRMYRQILSSLIPAGDNEKTRNDAASRIRLIINALVLIENPVTPQTLARLTCMPDHTVATVLRRLNSVIRIDSSGVIRLFHLSFADFLCDPDRCSDPYFRVLSTGPTALSGCHALLALGCLKALNAHLRPDLCNIKDPSLLNSEIADLGDRITRSIPEDLRYACRSWCIHTSQAILPNNVPLSVMLFQQLRLFCSEHLQHWIEAISLLNFVQQARLGLVEVIIWCDSKDVPRETRLLRDAERFLESFRETITSAALQVYATGSCFMPTCCSLRTTAPLLCPIEVLSEPSTTWSPFSLHIPLQRANEKVWNTHSGDLVAFAAPSTSRFTRFEEEMDTCLAFSPSCNLFAIAYGARLGELDVWNMRRGAVVGYDIDGVVLALAFSDDDMLLYVLTLWNPEIQDENPHLRLLKFTLRGQPRPAEEEELEFSYEPSLSLPICRFSRNGSHLAIAAGPGPERVCTVHVQTKDLLLSVNGPADDISDLVFTPSGGDDLWLAACSSNGSIMIWNTSCGHRVAEVSTPGASVLAVAFSSDRAWLLSSASDATVGVWSLDSDQDVTTHSLGEQRGWLHCLPSRWPQDLRIIVSDSDGIDVMTLDRDSHGLAPTNVVSYVAFSHDGSVFATAVDQDVSITIWSTQHATRLAWLPLDRTGIPNLRVIEITFSRGGEKLRAKCRASGNAFDYFFVWDRTDSNEWIWSPQPTIDQSPWYWSSRGLETTTFALKDDWLYYSSPRFLVPRRLCTIPRERRAVNPSGMHWFQCTVVIGSPYGHVTVLRVNEDRLCDRPLF
ncbi:hypothetical protein EXIGLDRAFT_841319 [Exidia glandulosa HHB12029]|uniref:NACHT domain-containing protein n=1 Tax=Exidia glandulosa HHB12029 TaxID=1314781 RepID=A0A165DY14_EXIGL|nr:hypothetical protein EXIGLDRAFT_841319 [Exidia glandulosa HHB12029]